MSFTMKINMLRMLTICMIVSPLRIGSRLPVPKTPLKRCLTGDCQNGFGTYRSLKRGWQYTGAFKNGKPDGHGKVVFTDGRFYEGSFFNGKYHGQGRMHLDAKTQVAGHWENGIYCPEKQNLKIKKS
jgi:hypothetical protein